MSFQQTVKMLPNVASTKQVHRERRKTTIFWDAHPCSLKTPPLFVKGCRALQCCRERWMEAGKEKGKERWMRMWLTQALIGVVMLPSSTDNVRTELATEEDKTQSRSCCRTRRSVGVLFWPHTLMTAQEADGLLQRAVRAPIKQPLSAVQASRDITKNCNCRWFLWPVTALLRSQSCYH